MFPCKHTCFEGFAVVLKANKADAASLDAGDVYSAVKLYGLAVVAKEIYDQGRLVKLKSKLYFWFGLGMALDFLKKKSICSY